MSYTPHNFKPGQILSAEEMNEIDSQVAKNSIANAPFVITPKNSSGSIDNTKWSEIKDAYDRGQPIYLCDYWLRHDIDYDYEGYYPLSCMVIENGSKQLFRFLFTTHKVPDSADLYSESSLLKRQIVMVEIGQVGSSDVARAEITTLPIIVEFMRSDGNLTCYTRYTSMFESAIRGYLRGAVIIDTDTSEIVQYYPVLESLPSQTTFGANFSDGGEGGPRYTFIKVNANGVQYVEV